MNSSTSDFLNASRWIAAFLVVLGHVFSISISMAHYYDIPNRSLLLRGLHFFSGFGHIAVIVFFVISGFLVGGRTILRSLNHEFRVTDYFSHRFSRIYTVFIPALIVGYIIDWSGIKLFNSSGIYNHPDQFYTNLLGNDITNHLSLEIFVGNLLQLQTIIVSSLGSNGPLWSLANEWWYYVLFGLCMVAYRSGHVLIRVVTGGVIVVMLMVLPLTISLWFVMWGVGAGVAVLDRYWAGWPFFAGATIAFVCLIAVRWLDARVTDTGVATDFAMDLAVALGYSAALVCAKNLKERVKFWPLHRVLASFSYTVYLVHYPAMVFAAAVLKEIFDIGFLQPAGTVKAMIYLGTLLVLLYGYAWVFATFTEAYTDTVRLRLDLVISTLRHQANFLVHKKVFEPANVVGTVLINDSVPPIALAVKESTEAAGGYGDSLRRLQRQTF
jgi:peptidoglycan/LPS O-acetylase OafA/YrhL